LGGKPVIRHTLEGFAGSGANITQSVVVVSKGDKHIDDIVKHFNPAPLLVTGGASRTESVRNGLAALQDDPPDLVLIHDAARPFVTSAIIHGIIRALGTAQAAVPVLPMVDAVKAFDHGQIGGDIDRAALRAVQTPQGFRYADIWAAFQALPKGASFSDDIAIARHAGLSVAAVDGDVQNFKLTYPKDMARAETLLMTDTYTATGTGFDVHRFEPGDSLWLCGVEIPAGISLKGHSDADVGLHALTDAILGALADGDIGDHFPPSDPQWAGAASDKFLDFAVQKVKARGGHIMHVDVTLICEKPKVKPHRAAMRARIADILSLPIERVSVKATTTEKLGFTGRGEGIAAQAAATVELPK
jgi:2-C-methyl-D-erythritol 4-phosphate cytidylyltransferase/2-C-methyl-D-erythritol 2,4-cyclodiphosphate synthase